MPVREAAASGAEIPFLVRLPPPLVAALTAPAAAASAAFERDPAGAPDAGVRAVVLRAGTQTARFDVETPGRGKGLTNINMAIFVFGF